MNVIKKEIMSEPWNKDLTVGQKKPFTSEQYKKLIEILEKENSYRDLALLRTAFDSSLRASDLLRLKVAAVRDNFGGIIEFFVIHQKKTGSPVTIHLADKTRKALNKWIEYSKKNKYDYIFTGIRKKKVKLERWGYSKIVKNWASKLGMSLNECDDYSTHSLRRTAPAMIAQSENAKSMRIAQVRLGHSSIDSTKAYLDLGDDNQLSLEGIDIIKKMLED